MRPALLIFLAVVFVYQITASNFKFNLKAFRQTYKALHKIPLKSRKTVKSIGLSVTTCDGIIASGSFDTTNSRKKRDAAYSDDDDEEYYDDDDSNTDLDDDDADDEDEGFNRIIFIVDESGSVRQFTKAMINQFNDFLKNEKKDHKDYGGGTNVQTTLIKFFGHMDVKQYANILDVEELTSKNYRAKGKSKLYDAIGCTFQAYGHEESNLVIVITDGKDKTSKIFKSSEVKSMAANLQNNKNWEISYYRPKATAAKQVGKQTRRGSLGLSGPRRIRKDGHPFKRSGFLSAPTTSRRRH